MRTNTLQNKTEISFTAQRSDAPNDATVDKQGASDGNRNGKCDDMEMVVKTQKKMLVADMMLE